MALLTVQNPVITGTVITFAAVGASDTFANTGNERVIVKTSGTPTSVVFDSPTTCSLGVTANAAHDLTVAVGATEEKSVGPLSMDRFTDPATGLVTITCTPTTGVTIAVVRR